MIFYMKKPREKETDHQLTMKFLPLPAANASIIGDERVFLPAVEHGIFSGRWGYLMLKC